MALRKKIIIIGIMLVIGWLNINSPRVSAKTFEQGVDWSIYQGINGKKGYINDKFAIIQAGGISANGNLYQQSTYQTQVTAATVSGLRAHTYIWYQVGSSLRKAQTVLNYFLPKVVTPKNSIVALDYESGATSNVSDNTKAVLKGMDMVKQAGYTPLLYTYTSYLKNVDKNMILAKYPNSLWLASYPYKAVRNVPDFKYAPVVDGMAMWQFTSNYINGGLDGNVDLLGVTYNGYQSTNAGTSNTNTNNGTSSVTPTPTVTPGAATKPVPSASSKTVTNNGLKKGQAVVVTANTDFWLDDFSVLTTKEANDVYTIKKIASDQTTVTLSNNHQVDSSALLGATAQQIADKRKTPKKVWQVTTTGLALHSNVVLTNDADFWTDDYTDISKNAANALYTINKITDKGATVVLNNGHQIDANEIEQASAQQVAAGFKKIINKIIKHVVKIDSKNYYTAANQVVITKNTYVYQQLKFSKNKRVKLLKKGTVVKVKSVVQHGKTSRLEVKAGYITGNRTFSQLK
ncbi:GH25 family lysozyme [Periweissella beninensis]|uniref:DUF5776 domain-containing protein n=1 Tax=Periweissella beninensis TaxID=504936 RepID=A0ABT0VL25_9LACO|nr:GH25 family lysozyme [Periweissella beninensis]MBM7544878.1 GH25 family lysozyme M1 (1,4-beta-N-acetylmuramidase)/HJR/Mrr/RecB family endonuclease [Periweissella beninensis]MCM2437122.1 hypothetical protein [Periweissella beninensis]MCT4396893.1 hypothetical protein [Periweissella beninensis]